MNRVKEINRLRALQEQAELMEEKARIKEKEREFKQRIKEAKTNIKGQSFLDKLFPKKKPLTYSNTPRYDEVFTEPLREEEEEILLPPTPPKVSAKKKVRRNKKKRVVKKFVKEPEDFILPDIDKEMEKLDDDIRGLGI